MSVQITLLSSDSINGQQPSVFEQQYARDHVWFNGYGHIERATDDLGGMEGEQLSARLFPGQGS